MPLPETPPLPKMLRVRQTFPRARLADIPAGVRSALGSAHLPVKPGDTVAVGAGSRGGATPEGQQGVLAHYGITEATMGCEIWATMDVVQVGEVLGLPVWPDRIASAADWIGLVNRVKPHTDFKGLQVCAFWRRYR